jgi:hypothetical protein
MLFIISQHSTLNIHDETEHESSGVVSMPAGSAFQSYPIKNSSVDKFRFANVEDVMFALEMNTEFVYNLLYKRINRKCYKAIVNTSILEALATVVLRCFDKDAIEELYLINLLTIDSPEVDRLNCMVVCWELAL